ncbi:hypothetical protein [Streptomyces sp. NPDC055287]
MDVTDFLDDLVQTQAAWNATYQALAAPRPLETTALRRRLLLLSVRLWWHPCWETVPSVPAGRASRPGRVTATPRPTSSTRLRQGLRHRLRWMSRQGVRLLLRAPQERPRARAGHHAVSLRSAC